MAAPDAPQETKNQPPPQGDRNLYSEDAVLVETVAREGGAAGGAALEQLGVRCGAVQSREHGRLANEHPPRLRTHNAQGRRLDLVEFHPSYHALMQISMEAGLHASSWSVDRDPAAHVKRAAGLYMATQMDAGHCCPITMTNASVAALLAEPSLSKEWLPKIVTRTYDPTFAALDRKISATIGMALTERQGGSDLRAIATKAVPAGPRGPGSAYLLTGQKWFVSAPMSDAFFVLAQAPGGLSCFLLPRILPGGAVNGLRLVRLKDKLGNRSNATAEAELEACHAWLVGEEGRGIAAIMGMIMYTRMDCAVASAGLMRAALDAAIHHARHRTVSGKSLLAQPVMTQLLADLALEVEAATALSFRLARAFDRATDARAAAWRRLMTPVTKYWVCKTAVPVVAEAMECLGGNGYVEELPLARLYREAPVNGIWEGSGNVVALDVLRCLQREPEVVETVLEELGQASAGDPLLRAQHARVEAILQEPRWLDGRARMLTEALALLAAGSILRQHAPQATADAFIAARLGGGAHRTLGQGLDGHDLDGVVARAAPPARD